MTTDCLPEGACVIGIDTSCYTTSVAAVDCSGALLFDGRKLLEVKTGELGLRQSDAFFKHVQTLPHLIEGLFAELTRIGQGDAVRAIAVSSRPRHVDGSYMPVFTAGLAFAKTLSTALDVPLIETDHQSGHIMAGNLSSKFAPEPGQSFIALHMSGGTTEIVRCQAFGAHFAETLIGGTKDLSMGSLIDRLGVKCGMPFPSGSAMEKVALEMLGEMPDRKPLKFPINHKEGWFNLSGMETYALNYSKEEPLGLLFYSLFCACSDVLAKALASACEKEKLNDILIVGGVASNSIIRTRIAAVLAPKGIRVHLADPKLSTDNAVGVAAIGVSTLTGSFSPQHV